MDGPLTLTSFVARKPLMVVFIFIVSLYLVSMMSPYLIQAAQIRSDVKRSNEYIQADQIMEMDQEKRLAEIRRELKLRGQQLDRIETDTKDILRRLK